MSGETAGIIKDAAAAEEKKMWEIFVPTISNEGKPYRTRYHRVWDGKVKEITGGMTIIPPVRGAWIDPATNTEYQERMIPVRVLATRGEMMEIVELTKKYYDQLAVLTYVISNEFILM